MSLTLSRGVTGKLRVVIIGGGFTGTAVALNLLHEQANAEIILVEPRPVLGAGLAYSATDPAHRVNVPASRMLVLEDEPDAFNGWLETSGVLAADPATALPDGRRYPSRAVFGRYVAERLARELAQGGDFTHLRASARGVAKHGAGWEVALDNGQRLQADAVVLAVSHPGTAVPAPLRGLAGAKKFFPNPWVADLRQELRREDEVLLVGAALSAADCIGTLEDMGHAGQVLAISRRGLRSRLRREMPMFTADFSTAPARSAVALLRNVRRMIRAAQAEGSGWEVVIETLRNQGTVVWRALPVVEQKRFLRHLRPFWDAHRYQIAPQLAATLEARRAAGRLSFKAARIVSARVENGRFTIAFAGRDGAWEQSFDAVVNCTGADHAHVTETNPALASLVQAGVIRPDGHLLGVETDVQGRPLDQFGRAVPGLFVAGPLARAAVGELMGLPQVTRHAALVARQVAALQPALAAL